MNKCPYFSVYHNGGHCKCVPDECGCDGNIYSCENVMLRKCYEDDLWEDGIKSKLKVIKNIIMRSLW